MTGKFAAQPQTIYLDASALVKRYLLAYALTLNKPLIDHGLPRLTFVAADDNLLAAVQSEGLITENPNAHP